MPHFLAEIKALIKLALPVALAQLAMMGMSATDVLIAGQAGTVELAGMNLGSNIWVMIIMFFMGIGFSTQPLIAKQFGAKSDIGVKHQLHQSMWLCFTLGLVAILVTLIASQLLLFANYDQAMLSRAYEYLLVVVWCAVPSAMIPAVRGALEAMNQTRVVLWINLSAFLLNIPLDYFFVNGIGFFPKMGGVGCALATAILVWLMFIAQLFVLYWHKQLKHMALLNDFHIPDKHTILQTFKLGLPIGISVLIELSMFVGAGILIAAFGPVEVGAHAVAITIVSMSFMLYMGLGQGVTIRASQFLGANNPEAAWFSIKSGTYFNVLTACFMFAALLLFDDYLVRLFSDDAKVIELAVILLFFGAAFQLADSLQIAVVCALRAYQDTSSPPKYQFVAFGLLGLPLGVGLAFYDWWPGLEGAKGLWLGMVVSLFVVGILLLRRLVNMHRDDAYKTV